MKSEIKRATGLLVIEVVNSNANGDPDRESDPRQRSKWYWRNFAGFFQTQTSRFIGRSRQCVLSEPPESIC